MTRLARCLVPCALVLPLVACEAGQTIPIRDGAAYQPNVSTPAALVGVREGEMVEATQNWPDPVRRAFWHIDQGSLATPYDLARAIEQAGDQALFMAPANIVRYRYVPQNASPGNPDALPLGFTKSQPGFDGQSYLGLTCSACHSTLITHQGKGILIDGAPTIADFQSFFTDMTAAFAANLNDRAKLQRLGQRLHGSTPTSAQQAALKSRLEAATKRMQARERLNRTDVAYGYGRVDAVGQIFNSATAASLGIEANRAEPDAPVSYPFLWGTHQSNVVQWNGFAPNVTKSRDVRIIAPLIRNVGEVLGVFGEIDIPRTNRGPLTSVAYKNSARFRNLMQIEEWLETLTPPPWPGQVFGEIDAAKAARGAEIYADANRGDCVRCHQVLPDPLQCYNAVMTPLAELGTDPTMAVNSQKPGLTGPLQGRWSRFPLVSKKLGPKAAKLEILVHQVVWGGVKDVVARPVTSVGTTVAAVGKEKREERCDVPFQANDDLNAYKARPLNGIWATAPFLHNGSVPTLRTLLDAPSQRPRTFSLGGWDYDPINVGYVPYAGPHAFIFDTTRPGNSNAGHPWGTELNDADKDALVEYLKTL